MALSDMQVFNDFIMEATIERVAQRVDVFNEASNGTIILSTDGFGGDFLMKSKFKSISNAMRRVNRNQTNNTVAPTPLQEIVGNEVKIAGGASVVWEPGQFSWLQRNPKEGIAAAAEGTSDGIIEDQLNSVINAAVAAIGNNPNTVFDGTASGVNQFNLNESHALFGDRSGGLQAMVMTGATYHKLIGEALTNSNTLFSSETVTIINILGKPIIVTDSPYLTNAGTGYVLSLASSGLVVGNTSDVITNLERANGKERIEDTYQVDYTFSAALKGYSWDTASGGSSPDDAAIGTGTNWDQYATSIKDTAGVMLSFNAAA